MNGSTQRTGLINLLALVAVGLSGFAVARYAHTLSGMMAVVFVGLGALVAAVSWFQMRLEDNERLEKLEFEELAKVHGGTALFEAKDAEVFPVQRSREQFERFIVPVFTIVLCVLQAGGAYWLWRWISGNALVAQVQQPITALALFALFALVLFILGKFSATLTCLQGHRLLRPGASYLLLSAYLCAVVSLGIVGLQAGWAKADVIVAGVLCGLLALTGLETLVNLILEMYRPRVPGKQDRPLYESRLVGLLGRPEGLFTTAAQALDYQFGFKVSETWFYRFFANSLGWLVLLQLGVLILSTMVVFIESGEQGLLERFGKPVEERTVLEAGAHLKWPWPIDKVYRYRTEQIQSLNIGFTNEAGRQVEKVLLWSVPHTKEDNFLVANREQAAPEAATNAPAGRRTPPVSFITGSIPMQFQITNLMAWAYTNAGAPALLQDLATRAVLRYFVRADMNEIMSSSRMEASRTLLEDIQKAADAYNLGARILAVDLEDLHPPVKVAPDYEKVVGAAQAKQARILIAQAYAIQTNALSGAQAAAVRNQAVAYATQRKTGALAKAAMFTNQISAYAAAPSVYPEREYLQTFTRAVGATRKYVLLTTNTHDVLIFDLQDKTPYDIQNVNVPEPKSK